MTMEKLFGRITKALVENGNISREDEAVYQYALKSVLILGCNILLSMIIGICMGMPGYCALFLCALIPLRSDAGGYHASDLFVCYLLSFASLILTMLWVKEISTFRTVITSAAAFVSLMCIFRFAPLESRNKPIEAGERKCIRRRAVMIVCGEWIAGWLLCTINPGAAYAVWSAAVWCAAGYPAWFIERKQRRDNEGEGRE